MLKSLNPIISHRGASAYAPENTMAAFQEAHAQGSDFIEFDVMLSADGHPFVFHDECLKRTTNGRGQFGQVTAEYIRSLDAGSWFSRRFQNEPIPSLQAVLTWMSDNQVRANIEIKPCAGALEETTMAVLACINRYWPHDKPMPLVSSFEKDALIISRSLSPELPLGVLAHHWEDASLKLAEALNCYSMHLNVRAATQSRVEKMKAQGLRVFVYTVNSPQLAKKLLKWGVDAVFSDYPDLL